MADSASDCTLSTINGTYVFEARGVIVDDSGAEPVTLPYAEAGILIVDGEGNAEGFASISVGGETWVTREAFEATYEQVEGCVYTLTDGFELVFDMYATSSGNVVAYYSPGFSGKMVKQ